MERSQPQYEAGTRAVPTADSDEAFAWGKKLHQSGLLGDAIECYRNILVKDPANGAVQHFLGMALLADNDAPGSLPYLKEAARLLPDDTDIWNNLAVAAEAAGALADAESAFKRCLSLDADMADARLGLAYIHLRRGHAEEAVTALESLVTTGHQAAHALSARAWLAIADAAAKSADALNAARNAVDSAIASSEGDLIDAAYVACFTAAGRHDDRPAQESIVAQMRYLRPHAPAAHILQGRAALMHRFDVPAAAEAFDRALSIDPDNLEAHWFRCFLSLRHSYADAESVERCRADYAARLEALAERLRFADRDELAEAERLIGAIGPTLLPYQGEPDRDLQALFGGMVADIMQSRHPTPPPNASPGPDGRIRIAFVSDTVYNHSNWKLRRGWLRQLDRKRFHVCVYHLGRRTDWLTDEIRRYCDGFHHFPGGADSALARLREDAPQIIVYPNVGLSSQILKLAALRIAPVQCTTWGHPVTSGLPTIDDYLSSELMEPPDGDRHYTERLVRLPGLSIT